MWLCPFVCALLWATSQLKLNYLDTCRKLSTIMDNNVLTFEEVLKRLHYVCK
uniref:Uncharacterized protein n=1 Tax=Anguilla anguilla TaxID=7936 RepID=A0A0E9VJQ3_ANGAN